jgi:manganese/zinc/iron transport system permease protein
VAALFKEFKLLCFDESYARAHGLPVLLLDGVLMAVVVVITIVGLQAVGLILIIALLVIPAAAARFWSHRMAHVGVIASLLGAISGMVGAAISALLPRLPSGAMIVLVATAIFAVSMLLGHSRGVLARVVRRTRLNARIDQQHLLRAVWERREVQRTSAPASQQSPDPMVPVAELLTMRSWSPRRLRRSIRRAVRQGLVVERRDGGVALTPTGEARATRLVRNHRLWEMYLITHADIAPSNVDRDADAIEHVLDAEMIAKLESLFRQQQARRELPASPHPLVLRNRVE